jgi:threonine/homoserine/homoserine lactone efflux protein
MPLDPGLFATFLVTITVLCVIPGPDQLFIVAQGIRRGPRAGAAAAIGMTGGMLFHTAAAVIGLSALVRSSAAAFEVLRYAGAAYLLWLAVAALRRRDGVAAQAGGAADVPDRLPAFRIVRQAMITNILNPKIIVFYVAFLPQFLDRDRGAVGLQLLLLGLTFMLVGLVIDLAVGISAGRLGRRVAGSRRAGRVLDRLSGVLFVGLAARLVADR